METCGKLWNEFNSHRTLPRQKNIVPNFFAIFFKI